MNPLRGKDLVVCQAGEQEMGKESKGMMYKGTVLKYSANLFKEANLIIPLPCLKFFGVSA